MKVIDLDMQRIEREPDHRKVSVVDLLRLALKDATEGETKGATKAMIIVIEELEEKTEVVRYRCGVSRSEEVAHLEFAKVFAIDRWRMENS